MEKSSYLDLVERRRDQEDIQLLFVGAALVGTKKIFQRDGDPINCEHVSSISDAVALIGQREREHPFDCVMVDMRHENDGSPLNVVAIAALNTVRNLVILCQPEATEIFEQINGVDVVLPAPVDPKLIIETIVSSFPEENRRDADPLEEAGAKPDYVAAETLINVDEKSTRATGKVTSGFETSLSKAVEMDQKLWQSFVPIASFLYKKLAIVVLSALFLAFITYGILIVFFMTSNSWSLPLELSRGHKLVEKAERNLSSMRLRQNQINQELAQARLELSNAHRDLRDGKLSLVLSKRTIEEEVLSQTAQKLEIERHIRRLKRVIKDFNRLNGKGNFAKNLDEAYAKRLITRKAMNSGTLAVLETMHRMATVENEVSVKQLEFDRVTRRLEYLRNLLEEIVQPELRVVTSAGADLSHLAREVIVSKNRISKAEKIVAASKSRTQRFENSLSVITANINSLEATPAARAIIEPVTVLFVPYTNAAKFAEGDSIFGCGISILWCSKSGVIGKPVDGETTAVHPLFGKPVRGTFVEAKFSTLSHITKELIHAGGAPLLF